MRKLLALAALALFGTTGCMMKSSKIPGANIPWADAGFEVMGQTTEEACGTYVFGIDWGHLFTNESSGVKSASALPIPIPIGGNAEESRALYHGLMKMPEATHLLDIRSESTFSGFGTTSIPLFGQRCSVIHARGVKIDQYPNPEQG